MIHRRGLTARRAAAAALAATLGAAAAQAGDAPGSCAAPADLMSIGSALPHVAERIAQGQPLTIVAIGSSSTWGVGASTSARNYPSLLEAELRERFPNLAIRVLNRGKNGEDAAEESARLDADAIAERPDLVIWQVGTNAVLRRDDLTRDGELIEQGVARLRQGGSDVVLMDLQYAPRVLARPAHAEMEQVIASIAKRDKVGLFRRFEIMQHWQNAASHGDSPAMIGDDGLHMTDRGYGCLAADFAEALAWNWWTQERVTHNPADARVAGLRGTAPPAAPFDGRP